MQIDWCLINWWSTIGLITDIVGVILLFEYGLPSKVQDVIDKLDADDPPNEVMTARKKLNKKIKTRATIGLGLIILGFLLQLVGNNLSAIK